MFLKKVDIHIKAAILIAFIAIIGFAATIYCFFTNYMELPLGILLGGAVMFVLHFITHELVVLDTRKGSAKFTVTAIIIHNVIAIASIVLLGMLYYYWQIIIFNLFAYVGVYTLDVILFAMLHIKDKSN